MGGGVVHINIFPLQGQELTAKNNIGCRGHINVAVLKKTKGLIDKKFYSATS